MEPRASSRSSASAWASSSPAPVERGLRSGSSIRCAAASRRFSDERHQPLLRAVVQVALQPAALGVAGLDEAGARRCELLARVGVRERLRGQLGEVPDPLLGSFGNGSP